LWGVEQTLSPVSGAAVQSPVTSTNQLCRISYKRPDSFRFMFVATIMSGVGPGGSPVSPGHATVLFNVYTGIGRSVVKLLSFERYLFQWAGALSVGQQKFSTGVQGPSRDDQFPVANNFIETIQGQDIQIEATATVLTPTAGDQVNIACSALLCPNVHYRPDWFVEDFAGEEIGGH